MRPRYYLDTSVLGGYFDLEFQEDTRAFWEALCAGRCAAVISSLTLEELARFLRDERNISVFKLPERLEVVTSFPMTQVGKIDKKELRRIVAEKLESEGRSNHSTRVGERQA